MSQQGEPEQIDRDYVRLLMVMRRFVRDEFDVKVAISEANAAGTLLDYAERSRNQVLQEMGKELRELLQPQQVVSETHTEEKVHYYRGVARVVESGEACADKQVNDKPQGKQRIYRGRVVAG